MTAHLLLATGKVANMGGVLGLLIPPGLFFVTAALTDAARRRRQP